MSRERHVDNLVEFSIQCHSFVDAVLLFDLQQWKITSSSCHWHIVVCQCECENECVELVTIAQDTLAIPFNLINFTNLN